MLNEAQARHLMSTFKCMDRNLTQALRAVSGGADRDSLSPSYRQDATPDQQRALAEKVAAFRETLRAFVERQDLPDSPPASALFAFQTTLAFLRVSLQEIAAGSLAGFGDVSPETTRTVARLNDDLCTLIAEMRQICYGENEDQAEADAARAPDDVRAMAEESPAAGPLPTR